MRSFRATLSLFIVMTSFVLRAESDDLITQLMLNSFKVANPKSTATAFVMVRPTPGDEKKAQFILVTANHVFAKMDGDEATLYLRKKDGKDNDEWTKVPFKLQVRDDGKMLWTKHPSADVAAMVFTPPADAPVTGVPLSFLANDEKLTQYEIHPGDTMHCVGYPHPNQFDSGPAWFPVVRAGCIAGFPLVPSAKYKTFFTDFSSFEGNSGGAVCFTDHNRFYGGKTQDGRIQLILGLLSAQQILNDKFETEFESGVFHQRLNLGIIVNATMIRETIDLLPKSPPKSAAK